MTDPKRIAIGRSPESRRQRALLWPAGKDRERNPHVSSSRGPSLGATLTCNDFEVCTELQMGQSGSSRIQQ
jgi:hypothetical protein